ncbi:MAG: 30S ribosomal protein S17 [Candidatus Atabeyarchaeum deiterrae]
MKENIGLDVTPPKAKCDDELCPFHGTLSVRGRVFEGTVVSEKMANTVVIRREYLHYVKKYMRYERRGKHLHAHNPSCIAAEEGDLVKIAECRPLSKTVSFVVIEKKSK